MPTVDQMREALKEVFDPEIPINVVDLGLIYKIEQADGGKVNVDFTVTSPACPVGEQLKARIHEVVAKLEGVTSVEVKQVLEPPWNKDKMTFEGKLQASMMGFG
jgi:metal-sulfur cluster biosynthetic enzyme